MAAGTGRGGCLLPTGFTSYWGEHQTRFASCCSRAVILWDVTATGILLGSRPQSQIQILLLRRIPLFSLGYIHYEAPSPANTIHAQNPSVFYDDKTRIMNWKTIRTLNFRNNTGEAKCGNIRRALTLSYASNCLKSAPSHQNSPASDVPCCTPPHIPVLRKLSKDVRWSETWFEVSVFWKSHELPETQIIHEKTRHPEAAFAATSRASALNFE